MVLQLEQEARRNVENDATVAGLKALDDKDSLAATLTGGLKRKLENMQAGDDLMLKNIEKEASQPDKVARKEKQERKQEEEEEGGGRKANKGPASIKLPNVDIDDVIAVIRRDRKRQMHALAISLARVSLLRKKEFAPDSLLKLTSSDRPRGGANRRSPGPPQTNRALRPNTNCTWQQLRSCWRKRQSSRLR